MSRLSIKRPVTPNTFQTTENKFDHWSTAVYECCVTAFTDGTLNFSLEGGSDNGEFPFFSSISPSCNSRSISKDDIILEAQGQKIAGFTQRDILAWLNHCSRNGNLVRIKAVKAGYLTKDLRQYLNTRFQRGSIDHDLQNTIRDNLYLRTVPCTTRTPRDGEITGVDYTFLTAEEFIALERSGNLLESGIYEGNHYGTPKPPKESSGFTPKRSNSLTVSGNVVLPGAHASSEGKRRRNRSNVEAMAAKADDPPDCSEYSLGGLSINTRSSTPVSALSSHTGCKNSNTVPIVSNFGILPNNWERACTENGEIYFIDHNTGTSQWLDPRLSEVPRRKLENTRDDELPFGWERIDDPHYGTYYIDHVNRRTQYENPVLQERRLDENMFIGECSTDPAPWSHKAEIKNNCESSVNHQTVFSDPQKFSQCTRNNSISQTTNSSNSQGAVCTTNSESFLISNNHSSSLPNSPSLPPGNNLSSSPASTHRFPYLHCIPCLSEKNEPPKHNSDAKIENIISNGAIASNTATSNRDCETNQLQVSRSQSFSPGNGLYGMARTSLGSHGLNDDTRRNSEVHLPSSLSGQSSTKKPVLFFTHNPEELNGEFIRTPLVKSSRGFGFTIIGGDNVTSEELLQIKDVVPNGPAWCNGKLKTGDVLVYVNGECVLGHTHQDIVALFQSIPPGEIVHLEVCRGYALPFDPNDPNTEIVTTVAVSKANTRTSEPQNIYSSSRANAESSHSKFVSSDIIDSPDSISRAAKSMPDLSSQLSEFHYPLRHNSAGLLNPVSFLSSDLASRAPEFFTAEIVKGSAGFGFTIADSSYGQKVKKILDRPRCKQLQEGDILNEINGVEVRRLPHAEVVQILKDCPCDSTAKITIQRGGFLPSVRSKAKSKTKINDEFNEFDRSKRNGFAPHSSPLSNTSQKSDRGTSIVTGSYRSKTPTADLYSSRDKEHVIIKRPKTPLVDTRNWSNIPTSDTVVSDYSSRHIQENDKMLLTPLETGFSFHHAPEDSSLKMSLYSSSPERQGNHSWYSDQSRGRNWNNHNFRDITSVHEHFGPKKGSTSICQDISEETNDIFTSPSDNFKNSQMLVQKSALNFDNHVEVDSDWRNAQSSTYDPSVPVQQISPISENSHSLEYGQSMYVPQDMSTFLNHSNRQSLRSGTTYNPYPSLYHMSTGHSPDAHASQSLPSQESAFCKENTSIPNYSTPVVSSPNILLRTGTHFENWNQRKHTSTSFEHEHPIPSAAPSFSKDSRPLLNDYTYQSSGIRSNNSNDIIEYVDMTVTLHRQESGFGFRIVGGTEEGSQVSIGHIVPCGAADVDGRLRSGDEILGVDGHSVYNTSHRHVVQLMGNAANNGKVTLHLRRPVSSGEHKSSSKPVDCSFPYDITVTRNEDEGFGFVIISSVSRAGSTIGRILESSPAERCGQLHIGDTILAVNGISILNMHHGDIVNLIKDSGYSVCLTIGHPFDDLSSSASISQKGDLSIEQDDGCHQIELSRGTKGFGFSIRGGKEFHNMPLFVLRIAEKGPAHQDGRLQVGDQIIEINSVNTKNMTHADAIELIRQGGGMVRLLIKRGNKLPSYEQPSFSPVSGSPLASSILSGPICQSSPRTIISELTTPDIYCWNYEQN